MAALRRFDGIYVADDVGDSYIRSGEFLHEARIAIDPGYMCHIAMKLNCLTPKRGDGFKRIVVDFRAGDDRNMLVQQLGKLADYPAFGLSSQTQQDDVVAGENSVNELRDDRILVAHDAGKKLPSCTQFFDQVR